MSSDERMSDERLTRISGPGYAGGPYIKPWIAELVAEVYRARAEAEELRRELDENEGVIRVLRRQRDQAESYLEELRWIYEGLRK